MDSDKLDQSDKLEVTAMKGMSTLNAIIIILLAAVIAGGTVTLLQKQPWAKQPLEITLADHTSSSQAEMQAYVGGAVASPGWYPCNGDDRLGEVLTMAGGALSDANTGQVTIHIPTKDESEQSQKISINRADAWLLEALPGIGPSLAQAIIDYRQANGPFVMIEELLLVPDIGGATFNGLKDLITVE
jgi:competence protein ComEA